MKKTAVAKGARRPALVKFILCSIFGLFAYFVAFPFRGSNSILIDHIANLIKSLLGPTVPFVCLAMLVCGAVMPFIDKSWKSSAGQVAFTFFKVLGIPLGIMYVFHIGPEAFFAPGMLPFLYEKLVMSLSFVIPLGSALIIFLTDFGLMEFIGVFARPFMRKIYKTPGRSAIDAVASFVGSYSIALIITGNQYEKGYYTKKEAAIIATGFSTVSATFCIVVAKTLGLMDMWNLFFWSTLVITFIVTAITVYIWPLRKIPNTYQEGVAPVEEAVVKSGTFRAAVDEGLIVAASSPSIPQNIVKNLWNGTKITMGLTPTLMSVGFLGLLLAEFTPTFDIIGYIFYPFTALLQFPEAHLVAKSVSMSIAEMLLPAALVAESNLVTRYVVGVVSISEILFFSASIPCVISNKIPITLRDIIVVWFERVVLTLLVTSPVAWLLFR